MTFRARRLLLRSSLIASLAFLSPVAAAEPVELSNDARADLLFHSGEKKFDSGDYAGACIDFSESLKLGPKLGALLNLALCHETTGKLVTAWREFTYGAAWAAQNKQYDRYEFAKEHVRGLETKLPRIVLQLPADRPIEAIDIDGEPVPEQNWYLPLYLDAGEHQLAVTAPGKKRTTIAFRVSSAPSDQLVMIPHLPTDYSKLSPTATVDPTRKILGIVSLGLAGGAMAIGTTFGVLAMNGDSTADVKEDATISTIAFGSGAALAILGGYLLWTSTARGNVSSSFRFPTFITF